MADKKFLKENVVFVGKHASTLLSDLNE